MNKILGIFIVLIACMSCSKTGEQVYTQSIDGAWNKKQIKKFDFAIENPSEAKNLIFVIRNNNDYPYSNLRLIAELSDEKGTQKITDTLNYELAKPNGEWLGSGFGEVKEILFQYKMGFTFPAAGKYKLSVIQAMRKDNLEGIEDIGIMIEPAKTATTINGK